MAFEEYRKEDQKRKEKEREKELELAVMRAGRRPEVKESERILLSNPTSKKAYTFRNITDPSDKQVFHGVEFTEYSAISGQQIIHGTIRIYEYDASGKGKVIKTDDIYMYQPRFEGRGRYVVGPRYKENNCLNNNMAYAAKDPNTGAIFIGNIPKREITTNRQFDFDVTNVSNYKTTSQSVLNSTNSNLPKIINIVYDCDPATGYIKTVNLADKNEKAKLEEYLRKNSTPAIAESTLNVYVQLAQKELIKAEKAEEAVYDAANRVSIANKFAQKEAEAQTATKEKKQTSLAEENIKMLNDMIKYGIRPSYASPMQAGPGRMGGPGMPPPPGPGRGPHRR